MKPSPLPPPRPVACLLASLFAVGVAHATVLVHEDFESFANGHKITTGGSWSVTTFTASNYLQTTTGAQSTLGPGERGLNFYHGGTNANGLLASYVFSQPVTTGVLTWSFDFRMPDPDYNANVFVRLVGTSSANTGPALVFDRSAPGNLYAWNGSGYGNGGNPVAQLSTEEWYRAVVTVDLDTRKYSLSLQGGAYVSPTSIFDGYNFLNNTSVSGLTHMQIATNSPTAVGGDFHLDNLSVAVVPEPSSFALLAGVIALPAAILRRGRRRD